MRRKVAIAVMLAALGILVLFVLVQWRAEREKTEMRAEVRRLNAEQMRQRTARAQACIDGIARRDPAADAAHDVARGDPTPIGISYQAHDPPAIVTGYLGAEPCRGHGSSSPYVPTGKWMTHTSFGFSHWPPPNQRRCEAAARRYAAAYNAEMLRRAPRAVAAFCQASLAAGSRSSFPARSR